MTESVAARPGAVPTRTFGPAATVAACGAFVLIGALQALYGPAIPALRSRYGIDPAAAGTALSAHFAGALTGVLITTMARRRWSDRSILAASCVLMAAGCLAFATASGWPLAVGGAFVLGLGFGGIDYGLNVMVASGFGTSSTAMLNILNAFFGLGAVAGPVVLGLVGSHAYRGVFAVGAIVGLLLVPPLWSVRNGVGRGGHKERKGRTNNHGRAVIGILVAFVGIYILHVGIETGVGGWEPSQLRALGHGSGTAALATTGFWLAMTVGRFLSAPLSTRVRPPTIVIGGCVAMTAFLALAAVPVLAPYAYLGVGLAIAPIFPTGLIWLGERLPATASAGAWVIAASMIGGVLFPPVLGLAFQGMGVAAVPLLLAALSAACLALALACRAPREPAPPKTTKPSNVPTARASHNAAEER